MRASACLGPNLPNTTPKRRNRAGVGLHGSAPVFFASTPPRAGGTTRSVAHRPDTARQRRILSVLDLIDARGAFPMESSLSMLRRLKVQTIGMLNDAAALGWLTERWHGDTVTFGLTRAGLRELDAWRRMIQEVDGGGDS